MDTLKTRVTELEAAIKEALAPETDWIAILEMALAKEVSGVEDEESGQ